MNNIYNLTKGNIETTSSTLAKRTMSIVWKSNLRGIGARCILPMLPTPLQEGELITVSDDASYTIFPQLTSDIVNIC